MEGDAWLTPVSNSELGRHINIQMLSSALYCAMHKTTKSWLFASSRSASLCSQPVSRSKISTSQYDAEAASKSAKLAASQNQDGKQATKVPAVALACGTMLDLIAVGEEPKNLNLLGSTNPPVPTNLPSRWLPRSIWAHLCKSTKKIGYDQSFLNAELKGRHSGQWAAALKKLVAAADTT